MKSMKIDHMHYFCPLVLIALTFLLSVSAFGQDEPEFGVLPHSTPDGMLLIIYGDILHPDNAAQNGNWIGYNLYKRRAGDTDFSRLNKQPVSRVGSLAELESTLGTSLDGMAALVNLENKDQLWQAIVNNDESVGFLSMLIRPFRTAMGQLVSDRDVVHGTEYAYYVTRVDINSAESAPSDTLIMEYGVPPVPLFGPIDVTLEPLGNDVSLSWKPNPVDTAAFSYSVYRTEDTSGSFLRLNTEPLLVMGGSDDPSNDKGGFVDTTAVAGRKYYYAVVSEDYGGNRSPYGKIVSITTRDTDPPSIPQNVYAQSVELGIEITWDLVSESDVAGYHVYRSENADSGYTRINEFVLPRNQGSYVDRSVGISDRQFYRVTSVDRTGNESEQSPRAVYLYQSPHPPLPPQNVRAETQTAAILITWEANDEPDVRGYYVYRADRHGAELSQVSPLIGGDTTSYLDTDEYLSARGRYYYVVQAMNYTGLYSPYSLPAVASPATNTGPDAPLSFYGYQEPRGNRLFWLPPDNNMIAGYNVYRAVDADSLVWAKLTATAVPRTIGEYLDMEADASVPYLYHLRAVNDTGVEGGPSHLVTLTHFSEAPSALTGVRIERIDTGLRVIWNASLDGEIKAYRIYRRAEGESELMIHEELSASGVTNYPDNNVNTSTRYYYSVSAVGPEGTEGLKSAEVAYYVD